MPLTAANTQPIQTSQMPSDASILTRKPVKKPKPHEPAEGAKHWSQKPSTADILRRKK